MDIVSYCISTKSNVENEVRMAGVKGMKHKITKENKGAVINFGFDCIEYLKNNMHKYDEKKQFQIAMAFGLKAMPSQVNQDITQQTNIVLSAKQNNLIAQQVREQLRLKNRLNTDENAQESPEKAQEDNHKDTFTPLISI